ncbi:vitamin K epoxide reductase family protein [Psychromicrobium xiongbiense]|uniref:vitamin K epoxide reductase family protein n=1 Tax=Psychromicrobium xiongbiense TaxID=3051184 RepID=UPI0025555DC0|nr:vitamin K epoxide reductase family protein [Psychromicrobium sp. YIM S02556]
MAPSKISASAASTVDQVPWAARTKPFGWLLLLTALVSFIASAALVLERLELYKNTNARLSCDVNAFISCGSVMEKWQASLFGFPNPLIGIVCFAIVAVVGVSLLAGASFPRWYWLCFQLGITLGMVMIVWLWSQALYVITILCPYCMIVWAMMIPLFVWTTIRNLVHGVIPAPAALVKAISSWGWTIVILLYLAVIATIFFRFINLFVASNA